MSGSLHFVNGISEMPPQRRASGADSVQCRARRVRLGKAVLDGRTGEVVELLRGNFLRQPATHFRRHPCLVPPH